MLNNQKSKSANHTPTRVCGYDKSFKIPNLSDN